MDLSNILKIIIAILSFTIIVLAFIYWYISYKQKLNINKDNEKNNEDNNHKRNKTYTKIPIFEFMQFDKVEDNMIVQDNGERYLMVVKCEGINYDLMSEVEKNSVEVGFVQFLNTLRYPIQIYTQTRTLKISNSVQNYKERTNMIKNKMEEKQKEYDLLLKNNGGYQSKRLVEVKSELSRLQNMYEYGIDIVADIEQMSKNNNILRKHYYIIIPYYKSEIESELLEEEEKKNIIFAELYTRAQSAVRTLFACSMKCKILDSNELVELLYEAYNRDDSETFGVEKALKAGYDELYSTAQDVLDKKMEAINKEIEEKALKLAIDTVDNVKSEKQNKINEKQENFKELVQQMAEQILKENEKYLGKEIAEEAVKRVNKGNEREGGNTDEEKTKKRVKRTTKTA